MALAAHHLALRLPRLVFESRPLALDPPEFADHRQAHGLIAHGQRSGHAHPPVPRISHPTITALARKLRMRATSCQNLLGMGSRSI